LIANIIGNQNRYLLKATSDRLMENFEANAYIIRSALETITRTFDYPMVDGLPPGVDVIANTYIYFYGSPNH
jgi:hypothetical protein